MASHSRFKAAPAASRRVIREKDVEFDEDNSQPLVSGIKPSIDRLGSGFRVPAGLAFRAYAIEIQTMADDPKP